MKQSEIMPKYYELSDKEKTKILFEALDYMQEFNGRSKYDCICLALGYMYDTKQDDVWFKENK